MDAKYITPFLESLLHVLGQFGIQDIHRGSIRKKDVMNVDMDITAMIGIVGKIRGNIGYSMAQETAQQIASTMMMGMPVDQMDEMARSAIAELSNMVTGGAATLIAASGVSVDITPPSIIFGRDIYFIISSVETLSVDMETPFGRIEVNFGLEV